MADKKETMELLVITHGKHQKGGDTVDTYDGPLTEEGAKAIRALSASLPLPKEHRKMYSGNMKRHLETVANLGLALENHPIDFCGDDETMFSVLDGYEKPIEWFWDWLMLQKASGHKSLVLIVSRLQAYIIAYQLGGGAEKFGKFMNFCNAIEVAATWEGTTIPLAISGQLHRFEI